MRHLNEGGNAIKSSSPIRGDYAFKIGLTIKDEVEDLLKSKCELLGSTGKKGKESYSGDIDIAIEMPYEIASPILINYFKEGINSNIEIYNNKGLKIVSIGIPYIDENNLTKIAQVDFMFVKDLSYSSFMYHSPNFLKNESRYKGLYRTNLLVIVASKTPIDKELPVDYFTEEDYDGSYAGLIKGYWKYSLSYTEGLKLVYKSYEGKKKPLKNPATIKELTQIVETDIDKILKIILGPSATVEICNSFESLTDYLFSSRYPYSNYDQLKRIFDDFLEDPRHQVNQEVYKELKEYINAKFLEKFGNQ